MKIIYRILFCGFSMCLSAGVVQAQDDVNTLLKENLEDATKLINGYVDPFMKNLSLGMNQGWYNTAKPHKLAGIDLTLTVNMMRVPDSDKFYNVDDLNLTEIELVPNQPDISGGNVPTIFGPDVQPEYRSTTDPSIQFSGPAGLDLKNNIGINALPLPMVQLGFGLPKGIELKFRLLPTTNIGDDGQAQMFGLGVMHNVKQYIPGIKSLPFDLSAFVGYTRLKLNYGLDANRPDQEGIFNVNATTIQGVISKKISVLTFYGGLGYNIAKSSLAINGEYDIDGDGNYGDESKNEVNPIQSEFSNSGPRLTGGLRLKLAVFTLQTDYTLQKSNCFSIGFGINVR